MFQESIWGVSFTNASKSKMFQELVDLQEFVWPMAANQGYFSSFFDQLLQTKDVPRGSLTNGCKSRLFQEWVWPMPANQGCFTSLTNGCKSRMFQEGVWPMAANQRCSRSVFDQYPSVTPSPWFSVLPRLKRFELYKGYATGLNFCLEKWCAKSEGACVYIPAIATTISRVNFGVIFKQAATVNTLWFLDPHLPGCVADSARHVTTR